MSAEDKQTKTEAVIDDGNDNDDDDDDDDDGGRVIDIDIDIDIDAGDDRGSEDDSSDDDDDDDDDDDNHKDEAVDLDDIEYNNAEKGTKVPEAPPESAPEAAPEAPVAPAESSSKTTSTPPPAKNCLSYLYTIADKEKELPLIGYILSAFLFFLAAISKKLPTELTTRRNNNRNLVPFENMLNDIYEDIFDFDDAVYDGIYNDDYILDGSNPFIDGGIYEDIIGIGNGNGNGNGLCGCYGGGSGVYLLPNYFGYGISLSVISFIYVLFYISWVRYNTYLASSNNMSSNNVSIVNTNTNNNDSNIIEDGTNDNNDDDDSTTQNNVAVVQHQSKSELILEKYQWLINGILLLWTFIGWVIFTFGGGSVFRSVGNGFFALWAMLFFSFHTCGMTCKWLTEKFTNAADYFCIYGLTISSIMVIIALTTDHCSSYYSNDWKYHAYKGIAIYTLVVCTISIIYGIVVAVLSKLSTHNGNSNFQLFGGNKMARLICTTILVILWIITACLTTYIGPFATRIDNGYIGVWSSFAFTVYFFINTK